MGNVHPGGPITPGTLCEKYRYKGLVSAISSLLDNEGKVNLDCMNHKEETKAQFLEARAEAIGTELPDLLASV